MTTTTKLWPDEYLTRIAPDHCRDVLEGSYDVPFDPKTPPVVLDIGANVGAFSRWAVKRWPGCTIHAYEPQKDNFALLKTTIAELPNVTAYNKAILQKEGVMELRDCGGNCGEYSFFRKDEEAKSKEKVVVMAAKMLPKADILKMDTEGAEPVILASLAQAGRIKEFSAIVMEYHNGTDAEKMRRYLTRNGFTETGRVVHSEHRGELKYVRTDILPEVEKANAATASKCPKIFIAVPCHDSRFHSNMAMSLFLLGAARNPDGTARYQLAINKASSGGIAIARNDSVAAFLETDYEYVLFCDSDEQFTPEHLDKLLAHDTDFIGALYPHKKVDLMWSANFLTNGGDAVKDGRQEVAGLGLGFALIKRRVFEAMIEKQPEHGYRQTWSNGKGLWRHAFFQDLPMVDELNGKTEKEWATEDWFFTYNCRKLGFKVFVDSTFHLKHHDGSQSFPSDTVGDAAMLITAYADGLKDDGKAARDFMDKSLPGWAASIVKDAPND